MSATGRAAVLAALSFGAGMGIAGSRELAAQVESSPRELLLRDPDGARRAIDSLLGGAAHASAADTSDLLMAEAARVASAYAAVWGDSIPLRTAGWFRGSAEPARLAKVLADSLRQAGNAAFAMGGLPRALPEWRRSLSEARRVADTAGMVAAIANIGSGFYRDRQPDSARVYLTAAYRMGLAFADYRAAGTAAGALASIHKDRGEYRQASDRYHEAASLHERVGDTRGLAADYNNIGLVAAALGDTSAARRSYERALNLNHRYGRTAAEAANLVNLGSLSDLQGEYGKALGAYGRALALYQRDGDRPDAALVHANLGRLGLRRGLYPEAVSQLREALATFSRTGPAESVVDVSVDLSRALAEMGALQAAVDALDQAERYAHQARLEERQLGKLALALAEVLARLNRVDEAEQQLVRAERIFHDSGKPAVQADAQEERALLDLRAGRDRRALTTLRETLDARELAGDVRATAATRLLLGFASGNTGDTTGARSHFERSLAAFERIGDRVGAAVAFGAMGQLALEQRTPLSAESLFAAGLERLGNRPAPAAAWWLHLGLGRSLRSRGADSAAAVEMRASIDAVEQSARSFAVPEMRTAFLVDKMQPYAELVSLELALGREDDAFLASERMRARELLDLLRQDRLPAPAPLASEAQALRERISDLTERLAGAPTQLALYRGQGSGGPDEAEVREALAASEARYAAVLEQARASAGGGKSATWVASAAEVRRRLRPDEAFVEYLVGDTSGTAFVLTADTLAAVRLTVGRKSLANLVEFARGTITPDRSVPALWPSPLKRLYGYLIQPLERRGLLSGKRRLFIVPHAELHYLPFATLLDPEDSRFLVERFAVSYAPSASLWLQLTDHGGASGAAGVLALAPQRRALPGADAEVRAVADLYGGEARALLGPEASERAFKEEAPHFRVLHIATFGVLNKQNPLFSYLSFQPGLEEDGRLEVHEVFDLHLHSRLVVLSACQTSLGSGALGDVPPGDDWVGLVQAFLYAGAARVLATAWPIADRATTDLMSDFYRRLRGGMPEDFALAAAQRAALATSGSRDPRLWGAFMLTGGH